MNSMIYLDFAATTPMSEKAIQAYGEAARAYYGNAGSIHDVGSSAKGVLDAARSGLAGLIGAESRGVFFTGSGSEANSLAIRSLLKANRKKGRHILTTGAEHSSVRNTLAALEEEGFEIAFVKLDQAGRVDLDELERTIREETVLISIHHANPETGTLQDLESIGDIARKQEVLLHSDCVQSFGKVPIDVKRLQVDSISVSAHKVNGPKGIGAAYINPSARWKPVLPGTVQEKGFRPGTVDVPAAVSFLAASRETVEQMEAEQIREGELKERLKEGLRELPFDLTFEGSSTHSLPNILGLRIHGMEGQYAMLECNRRGLAISTGSACSVGTEKIPAAMKALGRSEQEAREFVRLSLGKQTKKSDIDKAVSIFGDVLIEHFKMVKT